MAEEAPLAMRFRGRTKDDWRRWRRRWLQKLKHLMGPVPDRVPLGARTIERTDRGELVREKVILRADRWSSIPAYVLIPKGLGGGERRPGILCAHGHDGFNVAKRAVVGLEDDEEVERTIATYGNDYARSLAMRGYVTIAPDWRAFGERFDRSSIRGRDPCNVLQNIASWLGFNLLMLDVFDARVTLDYIQRRPEVDPRRLGMVGLSYGGRVTTFTVALDARIKVAVVSGALNLFQERIMARGSCGSQVVPGILRWGDIPEVLGLIAPRPLLIERGLDDPLLPAESFEDGYRRLEQIYEASGAAEKLFRDEFQGGHRFHGEEAFKWLDRWLQEGRRRR